MKEINYFDTPHDRRNGGVFIADFMKKIINQRSREIEEIMKNIPKNYINLKELNKTNGK